MEGLAVAGEEWAPPGVDTSRPSIARVYDYMLGGKDNFAVDRAVGDLSVKLFPDIPEGGRACRAFLRRVVRYLTAEAGIRQILDLGSGLPTQGNVHDVAHEVAPETRVVYVDNDPMVLAHGRALLEDAHTTTVVQADVRDPDSILDHPEVRRFIDFEQPVGLMMMSILHHVNDAEDPVGITERLRAALPPGSAVAIAHFHNPGDAHPDIAARTIEAERIFNEQFGTGRWRSYDEIMAYFGDFEMVDPGLVPLAEWRPDPAEHVEQSDTYYTALGGVARRR